MEKVRQEELKAHLMATNEEFRVMAEQHANYERLINEIEAKAHVTPEDEFEEHRLKKLKLHLKDQMAAMMSRTSASEVA
ncbi:MAG: dihydroxy-acid dehydratase [Candidatus Solibacter sp.]|nr:dihydroxy-acid dehydratase [Candidatus Solibacter sp.]